MRHYRVCFYNDLSDSYGNEHHVCQRAITVADKGESQAVNKAIDEFVRAEGVSHWRARAQKIECTPLLEATELC